MVYLCLLLSMYLCRAQQRIQTYLCHYHTWRYVRSEPLLLLFLESLYYSFPLLLALKSVFNVMMNVCSDPKRAAFPSFSMQR